MGAETPPEIRICDLEAEIQSLREALTGLAYSIRRKERHMDETLIEALGEADAILASTEAAVT